MIRESSRTAGRGPLSLSPLPGARGFYESYGPGGRDVFFYTIIHATAGEWESGTGHMADAATLMRDTVISSSNHDAPVDFSAGEKRILNAPGLQQDAEQARPPAPAQAQPWPHPSAG